MGGLGPLRVRTGPRLGVPRELVQTTPHLAPLSSRPLPGDMPQSSLGSTAEQGSGPGFGIGTGFEFQLLLQESHALSVPPSPVPPPHPSTFPLLSERGR